MAVGKKENNCVAAAKPQSEEVFGKTHIWLPPQHY
jgi:hypothetical protein